MTEIPEHLLKRSKERRAAMGLGGGETPDDAAPAAGATAEAGSDTSSVEKPAVAPAAARSAAPVPAAAPPPPPPDPPYVAAAKNRKKVPMWAAPVLAVLPLWGFIYFQSMQKPPAGANDPLALGKEVYENSGCVGCHGADGSGGVGAKLNDGEVLKTFKNPLAMVHWIAFGAAGGARANGTYGDLDRAGGPQNTADLPSAMPAQKDNLSSEELAAVTMYVRQQLSGGKPDKGFDVADFPTLGDAVTEVIALGPGGDPKVPGGSSSTAATTKVGGKKSSGSSTDANAGSSGAGSTGGTNKTMGTGTNSSGGSGPSNNADTSGSSGTGSGGSSGSGGSDSSGGSGSSGSSNSSGGSGGSGTGGTAGGGG